MMGSNGYEYTIPSRVVKALFDAREEETPTLLYDLCDVVNLCSELAALGRSANTRFLYSVKCLPDTSVLSLFSRPWLGFDAANAMEIDALENCLAGFGEQAAISITGPKVRSGAYAIERMFERQSHLDPEKSFVSVNVESSADADTLATTIPKWMQLGVRVRAELNSWTRDSCLRGESRFGVPFRSLRESLMWKRVSGLHVHREGGANDISFYRPFLEQLLGLCNSAGFMPSYVNLGGGCGCRSVVELGGALQALRQTCGRETTIVFEFGEWWWKSAGYALFPILDQRKNGDGSIEVTIAGSRECHLRWSSPALIAHRHEMSSGPYGEVRVFGASCFEKDLVGVYPITDAGIRDGVYMWNDGAIAFQNVSPYSAVWNSSFNGVPKAHVLFIETDISGFAAPVVCIPSRGSYGTVFVPHER